MANYAVKNEDPISGGKRTGKKRNEIDLIIEFTGRGRPQYVFEAKVLNWKKRYQRTDNYINPSGLGRFLEGEYADYTARFPEVGMIGYVLSDDLELWKDKLIQAINLKSSALKMAREQEPCEICEEFKLEWRSEHSRTSVDSTLTVYHILLDCQPTLM